MKIAFVIPKLLSEHFRLRYYLRYQRYRRKYSIHHSFVFGGEDILLYGNGVIQFGEASYIGRYSQVQSFDGCKVVIGRHCEISHFVKIYTMNNEADQDFSIEKLKRKYRTGNVSIGDYSWIGASVFISPGCSIGDNAVVGANSVVTRDIPSYSIAAGVPAKVMKFKSCLTDEQKKELASKYFKSLSTELQRKYV